VLLIFDNSCHVIQEYSLLPERSAYRNASQKYLNESIFFIVPFTVASCFARANFSLTGRAIKIGKWNLFIFELDSNQIILFALAHNII
jgi:hypothetical protein